MKIYTIKPLCWEHKEIEDANLLEYWEVKNRLFNCRVERGRDKHGAIYWWYKWEIHEYYDEDSGFCDNLEDGKRICEEVWVSAIEEVSSPSVKVRDHANSCSNKQMFCLDRIR